MEKNSQREAKNPFEPQHGWPSSELPTGQPEQGVSGPSYPFCETNQSQHGPSSVFTFSGFHFDQPKPAMYIISPWRRDSPPDQCMSSWPVQDSWSKQGKKVLDELPPISTCPNFFSTGDTSIKKQGQSAWLEPEQGPFDAKKKVLDELISTCPNFFSTGDTSVKEQGQSAWPEQGLFNTQKKVLDELPPFWTPCPSIFSTGDTSIKKLHAWLEPEQGQVNRASVFRFPKNDETGASYDQSSNQATHKDSDPNIPNNTTILVDNLVPNVVTEEQLRQTFTPYGEVNYVTIMKGTQFGFVRFVSRSCAEEAIRKMNGRELAGQNLKLSFSNKEERGAEYLNNDLPYGWSGSGIFRGLLPLCSDSGLPTSGWFSAPSPFMCDQVTDPNDPRIEPTKEDVESDDAVWALYKRWCQLNNVCRTPEEMNQRLGYFKQNAIHAYECNRDYPSGRYGLLRWADDPSKCPRGGVII